MPYEQSCFARWRRWFIQTFLRLLMVDAELCVDYGSRAVRLFTVDPELCVDYCLRFVRLCTVGPEFCSLVHLPQKPQQRNITYITSRHTLALLTDAHTLTHALTLRTHTHIAHNRVIAPLASLSPCLRAAPSSWFLPLHRSPSCLFPSSPPFLPSPSLLCRHKLVAPPLSFRGVCCCRRLRHLSPRLLFVVACAARALLGSNVHVRGSWFASCLRILDAITFVSRTVCSCSFLLLRRHWNVVHTKLEGSPSPFWFCQTIAVGAVGAVGALGGRAWRVAFSFYVHASSFQGDLFAPGQGLDQQNAGRRQGGAGRRQGIQGRRSSTFTSRSASEQF